MPRQIYTFPYTSPKRMTSGLKKLVNRWKRGGIEEYPLADMGPRRKRSETQRLLRTWGFEDGIEVSEHVIPVAGLPDAFRGLRVVHLTDIHHGLYLPLQAVMDAVELSNRLEPDVVALTGDFITYSRSYIDPVAQVLGMLKARQGIFATLGNHDFRVGADAMTRALRRNGVDVLRNHNAILRRGAHSVFVAGIEDLGYRPDLTRALRGIPAGAPVILLSHNPGIIRRAARQGVSLVLSGHTHGGQLKLPVVGSIYGKPLERTRFKAGLDAMGQTQIYVSRGIGTVVLPVRYRCPAEIPVFHLQPASSALGGANPQTYATR
jgi:predicted MPP superfamily phosphohydrolase